MSRKSRFRYGYSKVERATLHQVHTPECRKRGYLKRADAKKALRAHRTRGSAAGIRPYKCPSCGYSHLGHLPAAVREGKLDKVAFFG